MAQDNDLLLMIAVDEHERRLENNMYCKQLRDHSDPFNMPGENFRALYRFSPEIAKELFLEFTPLMTDGVRITKISKVFRFLSALHFFAHGSYQKSVSKDYHCSMSQSAVSRAITEISEIVNNNFLQRNIKFSRTQQQMQRIKEGFYQKFNFSGVVGVIDCTHVAIKSPPVNHPEAPAILFLNRKQYHSLNCQIICDSDLKIININARYPGSVHDSAIWNMSDIKFFLENNYINGNETTWLLGDAGYPLQSFLLTPILNADPNTPEGRYYRRHCHARNTVERCIGVFKSLFRCVLKERVLHYTPQKAAKIIYTCAVLYNILRERLDEEIDLEVIEEIVQLDNIAEQNWLNEGQIIRNRYIQNHCQ